MRRGVARDAIVDCTWAAFPACAMRSAAMPFVAVHVGAGWKEMNMALKVLELHHHAVRMPLGKVAAGVGAFYGSVAGAGHR